MIAYSDYCFTNKGMETKIELPKTAKLARSKPSLLPPPVQHFSVLWPDSTIVSASKVLIVLAFLATWQNNILELKKKQNPDKVL